MRTTAALLTAAFGAALAATPAAAHTCTATANAPTVTSAGVATGSGSHSCTGPEYRDMRVYVCLEVATTPSLWSSYGCRTYDRAGSRLVFGSATHQVCAIPGALLVRTTAYGTTSLGENDYAESLPVALTCLSRS